MGLASMKREPRKQGERVMEAVLNVAQRRREGLQLVSIEVEGRNG